MDTKDRFTELKYNFIGIFGKIIINLLFSSIKIENRGYEDVRNIIESQRVIFGIWHSRLLIFCYLYRGVNGAALISQSKDGELIARVLEKMGNEAFRGSTTRGGMRALVKMIKALKQKDRISLITTDGPQGPRFKVQPGIIALARKTGYPIVPATYSGKRLKIFASWDRFLLPYPFTTCRVSYGKPIYIPEHINKDEEQKYIELLEKELTTLTNEDDRFFGHTIS